MKIIHVSGCPYEDYEGQITNLDVELFDGEKIRINDEITIEMMDDTFITRKVHIINPKRAGDFYVISERTREKVKSGEYGCSDETTELLSGPCTGTIIVTDVIDYEIKTDEHIAAKKAMEEMEKMICLSPFKELHFGNKSIYDFVQEGYTVPDKVIAYLKTTEPYFVCPGIYEHPFKSGTELLGPYSYTDGNYYWDSNMWKYVVKYHIKLPQEFVDYVMSGQGDQFLYSFIDKNYSENGLISKNKKEGLLCLLSANTTDKDLSDF
ncbi:MAG: hypothetical protein IKH13_03195 [Clostridia bacterium]|nr:hypothetical protein [Clostridia bacterium]